MEKMFRRLKCDLTETEIMVRARTMARLTQELGGIELQAKETAAQYKSQMEAKRSGIAEASTVVNNGYEYRDVECTARMNYPKSGIKTISRKDTGEKVCEEPMTRDEMQEKLIGA